MPAKTKARPRIGVPWVASAAEKAGNRRAFDRYLRAVREAGGAPVEVSLFLTNDELRHVAQSLDGMVLPGSAADIDTRRYNERRRRQTQKPDPKRERVDDFLLDYALAQHKPVLAICYGAQILNVHLHGTLVQDIPSQLHIPSTHDQQDDEPRSRHPVRLRGSLAELAGSSAARVNSSHHQSILRPGRGLRVAARARDGVVEGVEWVGGPEWIVGVQWHPERLLLGAGIARASSSAGSAASAPSAARAAASKNGQVGDAGVVLAGALFRKVVAEAAAVRGAQKVAASGVGKTGASAVGKVAARGVKARPSGNKRRGKR